MSGFGVRFRGCRVSADVEFFFRGPGLMLAMAALAILLWLVARLARMARRGTRARPYAWSEADDGERAMSRAEVAAEFVAWNAMIERGVALLKALPRVPPGNARRIAAMGEDIRAAREAMLGEQRRLRRLRLVFDDPAEGERMERVLAAIVPLAAEMWEAASDPAGYAQRARQRGTRGGAGGDAPV